MNTKFVSTCYVSIANEWQRIEIAYKAEYHNDLQGTYKVLRKMFKSNDLQYRYYRVGMSAAVVNTDTAEYYVWRDGFYGGNLSGLND